MNKYALRSAEYSLKLIGNDIDKIPPGRLRWYSLADFLYSETLVKMINPET